MAGKVYRIELRVAGFVVRVTGYAVRGLWNDKSAMGGQVSNGE